MCDGSPDLFASLRDLPDAERKRIAHEIAAAFRANPDAIQQAQAIINVRLARPRAAVCPLFREIQNSVEQFGSGVPLQIGDSRFLCTAAHVADEHAYGPIFIPGTRSLIQVSGHYGGMRLPASGNRADDIYDIAYYRLDSDCASDLHHELVFLNSDDCDLQNPTDEGDWFTLIGCPSRRSETVGVEARTAQLTLSGEGVTDARYQKLGRKIKHHLLVQFRRKRAMEYKTWNRSLTCLPEGMSGGGVFAWTKKFTAESDLQQPKLVALITDYDQSNHVFVSTRLSCYIEAIAKHNPDLPIGRLPRPGAP